MYDFIMYDQLCSWQNLHLAYRKAAKGKRGLGGVAAFEHRLEDELVALRNEFLARTYRPGAYSSFYIHEPKKRLISAAPFRDRVVHHALCNVIEPVFEKLFIADSYANRVGKGTHRALDRAQYFSRRHKYFFHGDLRQFFPSIDHDILHRTIQREIHDRDVLWLVDRILESGEGIHAGSYTPVHFSGDDLFSMLRPRGLPIGNLTSQFWANVYLNPFDHFVKRGLECRAYLRFVDDFILFADEKCVLRDWIAAIVDRLAGLRVTMHPRRQPNPVEEGLPFLGFVIFPEKRRLKRRKGVYYRRKLRKLVAETGTNSNKVKDSVRGWTNHVRYGNTVGLQKDVLGPLYTGQESENLGVARRSMNVREPFSL